MKKKNISKLSKILLLIAVIFSYVSSPVAVLAEEIITNYDLNINVTDQVNDKYTLKVVSNNNEYDVNKDYKILINKDIEKSYFMYNDGTKVGITSKEIIVNGNDLNNIKQDLVFDSVSKYFNGKYHLTIEVYDALDADNKLYSEVYDFNYDVNKSGLTGMLNGVKGEEVVGSTTNSTYKVGTEGKYIPTYHILTGDLLPEAKYNIKLNNNLVTTLLGKDIVNYTITGTELDLTDKLFGTYVITDEIIIEEYKEPVEEVTPVEEITTEVAEETSIDNIDTNATESNVEDNTKRVVYTYNSNVIYGENNDKLFNDIYVDNNIKFENGYVFTDARNFNNSEKVVTIKELKDLLVDTNIEVNVKDKDNNILELVDTDAIKNDYILEFTKGATARYKVVVFGDDNLDNTFDNKDLEALMKDYLADKKVLSMDFISPAIEVVPSEEVKPVEMEEFGTITLEDVMYANELLKEISDIGKERVNNEEITYSLDGVPTELYIGDQFKVQLRINSNNGNDFIDGFEGNIFTNNNLRLDGITFNSNMTGVYNENGKFVAAGKEISNDYLVELTFTCLTEGVGNFEINTKAAKYLNIDKESIKHTGKITILNRLSDNNYLVSLKASIGTFDNEFSKLNGTYKLTVPYDTTSVILSGELEDVTASAEGLIEYELTEDTTLANILVKAENGEERIYTVYIVKEAKPVINKPVVHYYSSNNNLSDLKLDGYDIEFNKDTYEYKIKVKNSVNSLDIKALTEDNNASVEITGNDNFKDGENIVIVKVTAENGNVKEYKIIVNKEAKATVPSKIEEDGTNAEKIVIIILIVLVVLGLLYLIFKKDDEDEVEEVKEAKPVKAKEVKTTVKDVKVNDATKKTSNSKVNTNSKNTKTNSTKKKK